MKRNYGTRIIFVRAKKEGQYPSDWILLQYEKGSYYLGNSVGVVVSSSKQAAKEVYGAEKQFKQKLSYYTKQIYVVRE